MVSLTRDAELVLLEKRLNFLSQRLRWPQYFQLFWHHFLSDNERAGIVVPSGKLPDPIFTWARLRDLSPVMATIDLALKADLVSEREFQRLLSTVRDFSGDPMLKSPPSRPIGRKPDARRMVRSKLQGKETYQSQDGTRIHIWERDGKYIARGSIKGKRFGVALGETEVEAEVELRNILVALDRGTFLRPSEARNMPIKESAVPRLTIEQLCNRFCTDKRATRGKKTAGTYLSRLKWLIAFANGEEVKRKWDCALHIDREFVVTFRKYLFRQLVKPNGHPASVELPAGPRFVFNVLDCCRSMMNWALQADVRNLPSGMVNPFKADLVGMKPKKDPLRKNPFPVEDRVELAAIMDEWELYQFALPLILPPRPEEFLGLLISDIDFEERELFFGTRFGGSDFNKARVSFRIPFPAELTQILKRHIGERTEGPLILKRSVFEGNRRPKKVKYTDELVSKFQQLQRKAKPGEIQSEQDLKRLFRSLLGRLGGSTYSTYRNAFTSLVARSGISRKVTPKDLRSAITDEMRKLRFDQDVLLYVTCHEPNQRNIINAYAGIDVHGEMERYFANIAPLLEAISMRARELEL